MFISRCSAASTAFAILTTAVCQAQTLTYNLTCDNSFELYVSSSAVSAGSLIATGGSWGATYSGSSAIPTGVSYLHVKAMDAGNPAGFIGDFTVSAGSLFSNSNVNQLTNTSDWIGETTLGSGSLPLNDLGANGVGPWGARSSISSSARWIWSTADLDTVWFTTRIETVPEPATMAGIAVGIAMIRRRRKR